MTLRCAVRWLLILTLGLPLAQSLLAWVAGLLSAMGDAPAAAVIGHINTGAGVVWLLSLVGLVITLALQSLNQPPQSE
jgi:hypothetical protein